MKYIELKQYLKDFTLFSLKDIKRVDSSFHRRRLNEWQDKGYIRKVIKGYYIFLDLDLNEKTIFEISNRIYSPSYISLETALSYYGLIPETVYEITSVSTRRTYKFKTPIAEFSYRSISPRLFFGYDIIKNNSKGFRIASVEKTLLDYFYINTHIKNTEDFSSLRINRESLLKIIDRKKFDEFLMRFRQRRLETRMRVFWEAMTGA